MQDSADGENNLFPLLPSVGGAGQTCSSPLAQGGVGRGSGSPRRFSSPTIASAPKPAGSQRWPTPTAMRPEDILIRGASNSNSPNVGPAAAAGDDKRVAHPSSPSSSSAGGAKYVNGSGSWRGRSFGTVHINDPRPQAMSRTELNQHYLPRDSPYVGNFSRSSYGGNPSPKFSAMIAAGMSGTANGAPHSRSPGGGGASLGTPPLSPMRQLSLGRGAAVVSPTMRGVSPTMGPSKSMTMDRGARPTLRKSVTEPLSEMVDVVTSRTPPTTPATPGNVFTSPLLQPSSPAAIWGGTPTFLSTILSTSKSNDDDEQQTDDKVLPGGSMFFRPKVAGAEGSDDGGGRPKPNKLGRANSYSDLRAQHKGSAPVLTKPDCPEQPELCGLQAILPRQCGVRILEKLGEGSFGKVVLAMNKRNSHTWSDKLERHQHVRNITKYPKEGEKIVLKCVKHRSGVLPGCRVCMEREVHLHAMLDHPNIAKFFGHYDNGEFLTLILGFVEGKELFDVLRTARRLEEDRCRIVSIQALRALQLMHDLELAHRDVNTHNILVTSTWHVVLIDLGLAISVQSGDCECRQGKVVGTMGYIPPEVYQGGCCGVKGDMWAIGVVLYESLFGFKPFNNPAETMGIPLEFPDPSWGMDCSAEATDLMEKLLRKDESKRASAVEALFSQWFTIADFQECDRHMGSDEPARCDSPATSHMSLDDNSGTVSSPRAARWDGEELELQAPSTPMMLPRLNRINSAPNPGSTREEHFMEISLEGITAFPPFAPEGEAEVDQAHWMEVLPTVSENSVAKLAATVPGEFHAVRDELGSAGNLSRCASSSSFGGSSSHAEYFVATVTGSEHFEREDDDSFFVFAS